MSERAGWQTSEHGGEKLLQTNSLCTRLMLSSPRRERCVWLLASFYVLHPKQYVLACAPTMYQQMRAEFIKRSFEFYLLRDARDEIMGKWVETFLVYSTQLSSLSDCLIQVVAPHTPLPRARIRRFFHIFQLRAIPIEVQSADTLFQSLSYWYTFFTMFFDCALLENTWNWFVNRWWLFVGDGTRRRVQRINGRFDGRRSFAMGRDGNRW